MQNEMMPKVLKEYRKRNHLTVKDVSLLLHERSIEVAPKTIYGWESGQSSPSASLLLSLCEMYNITDVLSVFGYTDRETIYLTKSEQRLIEAYRNHPELHEAANILLGCRPVRRTSSVQHSKQNNSNKKSN